MIVKGFISRSEPRESSQYNAYESEQAIFKISY